MKALLIFTFKKSGVQAIIWKIDRIFLQAHLAIGPSPAAAIAS